MASSLLLPAAVSLRSASASGLQDSSLAFMAAAASPAAPRACLTTRFTDTSRKSRRSPPSSPCSSPSDSSLLRADSGSSLVRASGSSPQPTAALSLAAHHPAASSQHPLDPSSQSFFCGSLDRRPLICATSISHLARASRHCPAHDGDSSSSSSSSRGGCGSASMDMGSNYFDKHSFEHDQYIEAHVIEAVRMVPSREHLLMSMVDGSEVEVEHVNPSAGRLLYLHSMPTIFLRMADSTNLLLPIVVGDLAISFLMKAFKKDATARPNHYDLMKDMVENMQAEVKHVKVTQRIGDTYYARIYFAMPGAGMLTSVDARPSDAINFAVRAQVPIFVSKCIVHNDAVRVVFDPTKAPQQPLYGSNVRVTAQLDSALPGGDDVLEEISLIKGMQSAAAEERYSDAARLRDKLMALRAKGKTQLNKRF